MKNVFRKTIFSAMALLAAICVAVPAMAGTTTYSGAPAKYVLFFIGDGLGQPQRMAASAYLNDSKMVMDSLPNQGLTTTRANDRFITGSAASATAMACGVKTNINYIGVDPEFKPMKTVAEMAKDQGKKVGIISSVSIDHATPAAFYAHVPTRKMYHEIDVALAESGFDFFGGGGMLDPTGKKSKAPKGDALEIAKSNGYQIVDTKAEFMNLGKDSGKVIAWNPWLQDSMALPYANDMGPDDISLPEFTAKAIEMLDNDKGFFLMVEGGKIDWACHANDAATSIANTISFDEAVKVGLAFYKAHPNETLLVVTGDHECGGMALGFAGTQYDTDFKLLANQKGSFTRFDQDEMAKIKKDKVGFDKVKPIITEYFGFKFSGGEDDSMVLKPYEQAELEKAYERSMAGEQEKSDDPQTYVLYGGYEPLTVALTHVLNQKSGVAWTSYSHTGVPVTTSAIGVGGWTFNGYYDNTDIAKKIMAVMGEQTRLSSLD